MTLIQRAQEAQTPASGFATIVALVVGVLLFLLTLRFGLPPATSGLDPSWKEVLGWAFLDRARWGSDVIFAYGPTGFLYPLANYVKGVFWPFVLGHIMLTASFALVAAAMFYRTSFVSLCAFLLAFYAVSGWVPGEVSWPLTLLFGTSLLADLSKRLSARQFLGATVGVAPIFSTVALSKFSMLPLWLLSIACISGIVAIDQTLRRGITIFLVFASALLLLWSALQPIGTIVDFFSNGTEVASGYGHAMGLGAPLQAEIGSAGCLAIFTVLTASVAWVNRRDLTNLPILVLYMAGAFWAWRAHLTRGDHSLYFFALVALLPFGLLGCSRLTLTRNKRVGFLALSLIAASANLFSPTALPLSSRAVPLVNQLRDNLYRLTHLTELRAQRDAEWVTAQKEANLPEITRRVGNANVDMVGVEQGVVLLNDLHYAPRPVFQSYAAYTPVLARLNEAYFLGTKAPQFAILKLEPIDNRLPSSEDALALISLLRRYRPVMMESGFLLLQRSESADALSQLEAPKTWNTAQLGQDIEVAEVKTNATVSFAKIELTPLGRLYSMLLREPNLQIVLQTDVGSRTFRLIRPTARSGFVISPMIQSNVDWIALHLGMPVSHVRSFQIQAQVPWQNLLFSDSFDFAFESLELPPVGTNPPRELLDGVLPGFSTTPTSIRGINNIIMENGASALFLHAPAELEFRPEPGRYKISALYGIRDAALTDRGCLAGKPDGVGISIILRRADASETSLLHRELDPFHLPADRGVHDLTVDDVAIGSGDSINYRVDPGHGGRNTACDWSYVRNLRLDASDSMRP